MKFIVGKKLDMTQVWQDGEVMAATKVKAGPCTIVQVKTDAEDGYTAVQIGFGERKEKNIRKPQKGHFKGLGNFRYLKEFKIARGELKPGDTINVNTFIVGDKVKVTGISKGKGFQGVVKRHGFHGAPKSHGTKDQLRMPGSIGATGPAHVFKGTKMPGRMGGNKSTIANLEIIEIDENNNTLLVRGAVPGARNGLLLISGEGELKVTSKTEKDLTVDRESAIEKPETTPEEKKKAKKEKDDIEKVVVEAEKKRIEKKEIRNTA
jgi:large subunit ribosomal protein L3